MIANAEDSRAGPRSATRLTSVLLWIAAVASLAQPVLVVAQWDEVFSSNLLLSLTANRVTGPFLGLLGATIWMWLTVGIGVLGAIGWALLALASRTPRRHVRTIAIVAGCLAAVWFGVGFVGYWPVALRVAAAVVPLAGIAAGVLPARASSGPTVASAVRM